MEKSNRIIKIGMLFLLRFFYGAIKSVFPIPSGVCRHNPSCFCYAQTQIKEHSAPVALLKITQRLLICNPFFSVKQ